MTLRRPVEQSPVELTSLEFPGSSEPVVIFWRGIFARPAVARSFGYTLIVGVEPLRRKNVQDTPLNRIYSELTAIVASSQPEHCSCNAVFVGQLEENRLRCFRKVDTAAILSMLHKYYFAQTARNSRIVDGAPAALVALVISQRVFARRFDQSIT
jgi:hypothetical protein